MSLSDVSAANVVRGNWPFTGLQNVYSLLELNDFRQAVPNTLLYVAIVLSVGLVGGLGAAFLLQRAGFLAGIVLSLMVFTWAMPPVVLGSLWKFLLLPEGLVNAVASQLGLIQRPVFWLVVQNLALVSVALVNSWAILPFTALVFRAGLLDIPRELLEASEVDGATPMQQLFWIKLPLLLPVTLILTILTVVYAFRSFDFIYVMTYGGPGISTTTLPFLSYRLTFVNYRFGLGSAVALLTIAVVAVLAILYVRITRRAESK
jgi:multiple sugar transport system permease protein